MSACAATANTDEDEDEGEDKGAAPVTAAKGLMTAGAPAATCSATAGATPSSMGGSWARRWEPSQSEWL